MTQVGSGPFEMQSFTEFLLVKSHNNLLSDDGDRSRHEAKLL